MGANPNSLAIEVARALEAKFGGPVVAALYEKQGTREITFSDAAALAGLIMGAVQIAMQYGSDKKSADQSASLKTYLEQNLPKPDGVSKTLRADVIQEMVDRIHQNQDNTT